MQGIEKIIDKITQDAKAEAEKYYDNAQIQISEMKANAVDTMVRMQELYQNRAQTMEKELIDRAQSSAKMTYRNVILQKKTELIELAFAETKKKIETLPQEKLVDFLADALLFVVKERKRTKEEIARLYGEEEAELSVDYEVLFSAKDQKSGLAEKVFEKAKKSLGTVQKIVLSEKKADIDGGFILKCGEIESNCSIESLVNEAKEKCEKEVTNLLFS